MNIRTSLGDLVKPRREKALPADHPALPFVGLEHIEAHTTRLLATVPSATMKSQASRFYPGDVLYSRLRPYLNKVWRADREGLCSGEFIVLPGNDKIDGGFLTYRLNSPDFVTFTGFLDSGDRPRVDYSEIARFETHAPSDLTKQRAIVEHIEEQFSRLDAGVAALKRAQANLKRYRASVLKAACAGRLVPTEAALARERHGAALPPVDEMIERLKARRRQEFVAAAREQLSKRVISRAKSDGISSSPEHVRETFLLEQVACAESAPHARLVDRLFQAMPSPLGISPAEWFKVYFGWLDEVELSLVRVGLSSPYIGAYRERCRADLAKMKTRRTAIAMFGAADSMADGLNQFLKSVARDDSPYERELEACVLAPARKEYDRWLANATESRSFEEEATADYLGYETGQQLLTRILEERRRSWSGKGQYKEPLPPDTTTLPPLPTGWAWTSLGQAFSVHVGATPSRGIAGYWGGEIPWVSSGEVAFCRLRQTRELITSLGLAKTSTELHPPGTVLIGMIGEGRTRGQVALLDIAACNNQNSAAIRVPKQHSVPEYVYYYLWGKYEVNRQIASGNNQPALNKSRVEAMTIPLPPRAEQERIVAEVERRLSVADQLEATIAANLSRAARLRQSILQWAFKP